MLYGMTLKQSMVGRKIDEKEPLEIKKIYHHYLNKLNDIMSNTQFRVTDIFGKFLGRKCISTEQIIKPKNLSAKMMHISVLK